MWAVSFKPLGDEDKVYKKDDVIPGVEKWASFKALRDRGLIYRVPESANMEEVRGMAKSLSDMSMGFAEMKNRVVESEKKNDVLFSAIKRLENKVAEIEARKEPTKTYKKAKK